MKEIIKMLVVLTLITSVCGFALAIVQKMTKNDIEVQELLNVKGPAVKKIFTGSSIVKTDDDKKLLMKFIETRKKIIVGEDEKGKKIEIIVFSGKSVGKENEIAYEMSAPGYKGPVGVMVGFDQDKKIISNIGITLHKETPGLGALITENSFSDQFKGMSITEKYFLKKEKGTIDAVTGATYSSKAVCEAIRKAIEKHETVTQKIKK